MNLKFSESVLADVADDANTEVLVELLIKQLTTCQ